MPSLPALQGVYYVATGLWPFASRRTFGMVTGPKVDWWLVQTVGALVTVIGGALLVAGRRGAARPEVVLLGAGSATALAAVDAVHAARGRISRVYLLDALAEAAIAVGWLAAGGQAAGRSAGAPRSAGRRDPTPGEREARQATSG